MERRFNILIILATLLSVGCGQAISQEKAKATPKVATPLEPKKITDKKPVEKKPADKKMGPSLGELVKKAEEQPKERVFDPLRFSPPEVNEDLCRARKIRKIESQHLTLYTDLPENPAVDELPQVFDAAVPQWAEYFEVPLDRVKKWRMVASLAREKERFYGTGLWPETLPPFLHGFMAEGQFWCYEQPSDYYRRHLVLHEGTHGFMQAVCGGLGPPWYAEGIAELLGTHEWDGKKLTLGVIPKNREATPLWGRIKIIKDAIAADAKLATKGEIEEPNVVSLPAIMDYSNKAHLKTDAYAWSWAAALFCDRDPGFRPHFRSLQKSLDLNTNEFAVRFWNLVHAKKDKNYGNWDAFIANLDYGYDFEREIVVIKASVEVPENEVEFTIDANHGWQSSGYHVRFNRMYQITATGKFQIAKTTKPWISEPDGITLRYHQGQPLGKLMAAVAGAHYHQDDFFKPHPIGSQAQLKINPPGYEDDYGYTGELYLRVNDSPAELADNEGKITVKIKLIPAK